MNTQMTKKGGNATPIVTAIQFKNFHFMSSSVSHIGYYFATSGREETANLTFDTNNGIDYMKVSDYSSRIDSSYLTSNLSIYVSNYDVALIGENIPDGVYSIVPCGLTTNNIFVGTITVTVSNGVVSSMDYSQLYLMSTSVSSSSNAYTKTHLIADLTYTPS